VADYLTALEKELAYTAELFRDKVLDSVYIGGGTPTTLAAPELERLLSRVKALFPFETVKEFTVEAGRADSITEEKLQVLKRYGVTRISVNPQTMKPETLKLIGRQHTVEQVVDAFRMARGCGFTNINMDLILGLPGEQEEDIQNTVQAVKALAPDSLTVHSLAIKKASRLNRWIQDNRIRTIHNTDAMMQIAARAAADMDMKPYYLYRQKNISGNFENVGYAKEGCFGLYNILIMEEKQTIAACGAGSITKRVFPDGRIERCDNVKDVGLFIEKIDEMLERKRKLFQKNL
jgi:oxygen-independent coproporphyrinogen-3 oxidase